MHKLLPKFKFLLLPVFLAIIFQLSSDMVLADTKTLYPTADAQITNSSQANNNFGSAVGMWFSSETIGGSTVYEHNLFQFDHYQIPEYATINSAKLYLYVEQQTKGAQLPISVTVKRITSSWQENTVTWNSKPNAENSPQVTGTIGPQVGKYYVFDVTSIFKGWYKYDFINRGIYVQPSAVYGSVYRIASRESSSSMRPKIVVDYTPYQVPTPTPIKILKLSTPTPTLVNIRRISTPTPTPNITILRGVTPTISIRTNITPPPTSTRPNIIDRRVIVGDREALFRITIDKEATLSVSYQRADTPGEAITVESNEYLTYHEIPVANLEPETRYYYTSKIVDRNGLSSIYWLPLEFTTIASGNVVGDNPEGVQEGECNDPMEFDSLFIKNVSFSPTIDGAIFSWETKKCHPDGTLADQKASQWVYVEQNVDPGKHWDNYEYNFGKDQISDTPHQVEVKNLDSNTTYNFRVYSKDENNQDAVTNIGEFTTLAADGSSPEEAGGSEDNNQDSGVLDRVSGVLASIPVIGGLVGNSDDSNDLSKRINKADATQVSNNSTFDKLSSLKLNLLQVILILIIVLLIAYFVFRRKTGQDKDKKEDKDNIEEEKEKETETKEKGKKEEEEKEENDVKENEKKDFKDEEKPKNSKKKFVIIGGILIFLFLVLPVLTSLSDLAFIELLNFRSRNIDQQVDEFLAKNDSLINAPVINSEANPEGTPNTVVPLIQYKEIPEEFEKIQLNCEDTSFAPRPLRNQKLFCENVYRAKADTLLADFNKSGKDRLVFYGESSYFDCPLHLGKTQNLINKCLNAALFLDYWQMHKMSEIIGVPALTNKLYVYYDKKEKISSYCNLSSASACFNGDEHALYLSSPATLDGFYKQQYKASVFEGKNHAVEYSFNMSYPSSCYSTFVHEMIHYFNNQYFGYNISHPWFAEGIVYLLDPYISKDLCPPGPSFTNVTRKEGGNVTKLSSMDLTVMDLEEPMSSAIESYTEGNRCMNTIFMEVARYYREQGSSIIPKFYFEIKRMEKSYEHDFARALYLAEGSPDWLKNKLTESGCDLNR